MGVEAVRGVGRDDGELVLPERVGVGLRGRLSWVGIIRLVLGGRMPSLALGPGILPG